MKKQDTGTYGAGIVGALIGSLLGAVVWAIVLYMGYFASIIGFLISWLAKKGYEIAHGKSGKGKFFIILIVSVSGVIAGTLAADVMTLGIMIQQAELPGMQYRDIIPLIINMLQTDSEYLTLTLKDMGVGLVFAFLGMVSILRETKADSTGFKMKNL